MENSNYLGLEIDGAMERFAGVGKIDYKDNSLPRLTIAFKAGSMFDGYISNLMPEERKEMNEKALEFKRALAVVIEAAGDCSEIIGVELPRLDVVDFGENSPLERIVMIGNKVKVIEVNSRFISKWLPSFSDGEPWGLGAAKRELRQLTAHEIYHIKLARNFPFASGLTTKANLPGSDKYDKDWGERACLSFGKSYDRYKMSHETNPDKIEEL